MSLSWAERKVAKHLWDRRLERAPDLRRLEPLLGMSVLAGAIVLRDMGQAASAEDLESLGQELKWTQRNPVGVEELESAIDAVRGIWAKVRTEIQKPIGVRNHEN